MRFYKYQATGNDFILFDNRAGSFPQHDTALISRLCDRHFGIGSDGLILLEETQEADFKMVFFNPDGSRSFCGNGSRAAVHLAHTLGLIGNSGTFTAIDGLHEAHITEEAIEIHMADARPARPLLEGYFVDTGSPHYILEVNNLEEYNVASNGRQLRCHSAFAPAGANINFVARHADGTLSIRTYERGVEGETLSCGTGVTAAALALGRPGSNTIIARGGQLTVRYRQDDQRYHDIWLCGPAICTFTGEIDL